MTWLAVAASAGAVIAGLRWLRVAQREHYLVAAGRFARRWWTSDRLNLALVFLGLLAAATSSAVAPLGLVTVAVAILGPVGLGIRGRTSPLTWTGRLRRLAAMTALLATGLLLFAASFDLGPVLVLVPLAMPWVVDLAVAVMAPVERRTGRRWVERAASTLRDVAPTVVAITGSFGKTSTKNLVAHLLSGTTRVVASPASFNNRMGLARAVNEHLVPGTEVFVAEMGTYGAGEIRELCRWIPPDVAVVTALGPVHLERMGSEEAIAAAKREILEHAPTAVISVDHPLLAAIAAEEEVRRVVVTVTATDGPADVVVSHSGEVVVRGERIGSYPPATAHPGNMAAAVGVLVALGRDPRDEMGRWADLPEVPHRRTVGRSERGFDIVDDTFNANPDGARAALDRLAVLGTSGRKVLVTPGLVEMGAEQERANRAMCRDAAGAGVTDLVVVGRTNRQALMTGAREAGIGSVIVCDTRDDAVRWVRETLAAGDAVLYENDLPDHYP
jgi:UDP-N-acetylmuramoyl-tripeptide--D-alanyl-D-alanine ligase